MYALALEDVYMSPRDEEEEEGHCTTASNERGELTPAASGRL